MLSSGINFKNFEKQKKNQKIKKKLEQIIKDNNQVIQSLKKKL